MLLINLVSSLMKLAAAQQPHFEQEGSHDLNKQRLPHSKGCVCMQAVESSDCGRLELRQECLPVRAVNKQAAAGMPAGSQRASCHNV